MPQPLDQQIGANTDDMGNITFNVPSRGVGIDANVTFVVPGAPTTAVFTLMVASAPYGTWVASASMGEIRVPGNAPCRVVGRGLSPSSPYVLTLTGQVGPDLSPALTQPVPLVASQSLQIQFTATGSSQTLLVPANVTSITVDMAGASGGGFFGTPGSGGRIQAVIPVIPGETLTIDVAQAPAGNIGGFGAGVGGNGFNGTSFDSGGGGGASGILRGATNLLIAGGGGGSGVANNGGPGGGKNAASGAGVAGTTTGGGGGGGTQAAGGAAGNGASGANPGTAGTSLAGGDGGTGNVNPGGGGGGGFFGGGGGGAGNAGNGGGGGGGSDYVTPSATSVIETPGFQVGDGYVTVVYTV